MKLFGLYFSAVLMLFCCLLHIRGHSLCQRKLITQINVTTELQSEILLPCRFDPAHFNFTVNVSVVWTQINTTVEYIVDIPVNGQTKFWNKRAGRIKTFSDGSASGNFSILIRHVQLSDLGLYCCEIFRAVNCSLGYKEISLSLVEFSLLNNWLLIVAGGGGGGFLFLGLVAVCVYYIWTKRQTTDASVDHRSHCRDSQATDEVTYASVAHKSRTCHDSEVLANENPVNDSESEHVNSETVLYAAVKQRDRR